MARISPVTLLQPLMWPQAGVESLFLRAEGAVIQTPEALTILPGSRVDFDTWFNLFNLGTWQRHCALGSLCLELHGVGEVLVRLSLSEAQGLGQRRDLRLTLDPKKPIRIDLADLLEGACAQALISFALTAIAGEVRLQSAAWGTFDAPQRSPDLTLAITTFRREAEVANTIDRFAAFRAASPLRDHLRMIVTDNGQSLDLDPPEGVRLVPNANLGGAGGFTRGYLEARDAGASHVLFMDDDASIYMDSLTRTWAFLAYATDPKTALSGAMSTEAVPFEVWENGALFFTQCIPEYMGWDLRGAASPELYRRNDIRKMEYAVSNPAPGTLYGGWWFFAFPVAAVKRLAFPFFVRGDDVSFSLAHDFNIVRLNGVVSYQESFTDKESPQTWYLDLRSHMAHHLSLPDLEIGRIGVMKIALKFFLRNLVRMHYDTLKGISLAVEDVTRGPDFFDEHADMAVRRGDLKALSVQEAWGSVGDRPLPPERDFPPSPLARLLMKLTLNGLLIPFYSRLGAAITLRADTRGALGHAWGASSITVLSGDKTKSYTVTHSKTRAVREIWRFTKVMLAFYRAYPGLLQAYRAGYDRLTSESYWRKKLGLESKDPRP